MTLPKSVARFNRVATNRVTGMFAGRVPGFAMVVHRGRRSGREYRTPVNVFRRSGGYRFALTYGADTDWVRNVLAAGGCRIRTVGRDVSLSDPRLGSDPQVSWPPWPVRKILRATGSIEYLDCAVSHGAGPD
jgi:deazaflavin-dependent oxidoreductase (nitroreductase family)